MMVKWPSRLAALNLHTRVLLVVVATDEEAESMQVVFKTTDVPLGFHGDYKEPEEIEDASYVFCCVLDEVDRQYADFVVTRNDLTAQGVAFIKTVLAVYPNRPWALVTLVEE